MKNKRFAIVAIVLVAVLCIGVAFAALVDEMSFGGSVGLNKEIAEAEFNSKVHFDTAIGNKPEAEPPASAKTDVNVGLQITSADNSDANDHLEITVPAGILNFTGEEVVVTAYIINESDEFAAKVTLPTTVATDDGDLCDVTCKIKGENNASLSEKVIEKGKSEPIYITIKLKQTVTGDTPVSGTFNVTFNATAQK